MPMLNHYQYVHKNFLKVTAETDRYQSESTYHTDASLQFQSQDHDVWHEIQFLRRLQTHASTLQAFDLYYVKCTFIDILNNTNANPKALSSPKTGIRTQNSQNKPRHNFWLGSQNLTPFNSRLTFHDSTLTILYLQQCQDVQKLCVIQRMQGPIPLHKTSPSEPTEHHESSIVWSFARLY